MAQCLDIPLLSLSQPTSCSVWAEEKLAVTDQNVNIRRGGEQRTQLFPQNGRFCDWDNLTSLRCVGSHWTERESESNLELETKAIRRFA